jgi:hypothetical protein
MYAPRWSVKSFAASSFGRLEETERVCVFAMPMTWKEERAFVSKWKDGSKVESAEDDETVKKWNETSRTIFVPAWPDCILSSSRFPFAFGRSFDQHRVIDVFVETIPEVVYVVQGHAIDRDDLEGLAILEPGKDGVD